MTLENERGLPEDILRTHYQHLLRLYKAAIAAVQAQAEAGGANEDPPNAASQAGGSRVMRTSIGRKEAPR